jgi:hypothetical protein
MEGQVEAEGVMNGGLRRQNRGTTRRFYRLYNGIGKKLR